MSWLNSSIAALMHVSPKWFFRPFAKSYVAGESIDSALEVVRKLNEKGFSATMDILGEFVETKDEAENILNAYSTLIQQIAQENLDSTISVKLTHLGLGLDPNLGKKNILKLAQTGKENNVGVTIDMENSPYTSTTFALYKKALSIHNGMGAVIQAYLHRSLEDIQELNSPLLNLRICKGIYRESPDIAIQDRNAINDNYVEMARAIFNGTGYACLATHDLGLLDRLESLIENENISPQRFEFQVLYGVPMGDRLERLKAMGYKVRVYVPFGEAWFEYAIRRLKENPTIISYVIKNMFRK
ncbi:MAG: proline dehydrogenase family protein [Candidatus Marinimicrobia bacterium]|nr:proline dehydrogenase family protein [Candidatus Neomarinimicrobiota bacterium]MBL7009969.1 proline dehydrogenase family protein [Candidatus Neomarinimicrobiota bacterium]MBL7029679.1 proline dehydrogenase family protein [Candidatus Neomarinimicrobiota bacterium]